VPRRLLLALLLALCAAAGLGLALWPHAHEDVPTMQESKARLETHT
jgi:hypothetical protein